MTPRIVAHSLVLGLALTATACRDVSPVSFTAPAALSADSGVADAGQDAEPADRAATRACRSCVFTAADTETQCGRDARTCIDDARCLAVLECTFQSGCAEVSTQKERATCARPCFLKGGLTSFDDPLYAKFMALFSCFYDECACFPP